jgi:hypothetical protein
MMMFLGLTSLLIGVLIAMVEKIKFSCEHSKYIKSGKGIENSKMIQSKNNKKYI